MRAYWNEPLPLRLAYPNNQETVIQGLCYGFGIMFVLAALCIPDPSGMTHFPGSMILMFGVMATFAAVGVGLFWAGNKIGDWQQELRWRKAFFINNADLNLNRAAIRKTIRHMKATTEYSCIDFQHVAISAAIRLRCADSYEEQPINSASYEAAQNYQYFTTGEGSLASSRCPRRS